jgi:uncharacterized protein (DUF58 family)
MEYAESRPYAPGDDARHIDWRLTARSGKLHTKLFQAERERVTLVVADTSPSLYFGTRVRFKSVQAARAGAVAVWAAQARGDRIGALRGTRSEPSLAPLGGNRGALRTLDALVRWYTQRPVQDAGLEQAFVSASRLLHPGASLIVLSDPTSLANLSQERLASLAMHHDLLVVMLADPFELHPPRKRLPFTLGEARFELDFHGAATLARWRSAFVDVLEAQTRRLRGLNARVRLLRNDDGIDVLLAALLDGRRAAA